MQIISILLQNSNTENCFFISFFHLWSLFCKCLFHLVISKYVFHAPIIALNKFGSRSNTRAWWRPYWFWSFSCFLQDFNYSASCTLGKKFGGTVCKPAPLQPWFRCMPPVHLDHQSQALHLICLAPPIQAPSTGRFLGAQQASRLGSAPCRSLSRVLPPPPPQVILYSHLPRRRVSLHSPRTRMISHAWIHFFTATSTCVIRRCRCVPLCRSRMPPPLYDYCRWWVKIRFISGIKGPYGWLTWKPIHRIRKLDGKMMLSCCTAKPVLYILDSICCSSGNISMYSV